MTAPIDEARLRELAEAEKRLREEIDGYRVAAEIERGVYWSLAPYVDQWQLDRSSGRDGIDMLTRFVRESSSSRDNAKRMDRLADDTQLVLDALSAERERGDRAVGLLRQAHGQIRECRLSDAHAARTGQEGRWDRALHALTSSEEEYRAFLATETATTDDSPPPR